MSDNNNNLFNFDKDNSGSKNWRKKPIEAKPAEKVLATKVIDTQKEKTPQPPVSRSKRRLFGRVLDRIRNKRANQGNQPTQPNQPMIPIINIGGANKDNIQLIIIAIMGIFILFTFFKGNPIADLINDPSEEYAELQEEIDNSREKQDSLQKVAEYYMLRDIEWRKRDSIKAYEVEKQKIISQELRIEKVIAQQETERVKKELKEFKTNPPVMDDFIKLIEDTKKRIKL